MEEQIVRYLIPATGLISGLIGAYVGLQNRLLLAEVRKEIAELENRLIEKINGTYVRRGECGLREQMVHERIADHFLGALTANFARVTVGDPMDDGIGMGPLCSIDARDEIAAQVDRAVKAGATRHYGGAAIPGPGAFYQPTILTNITRDNPAYFEEFFGPVAQVHLVRDDDEAVALANDSRFGLSGAIFSADIDRAKRMASRIETGSVWINTRSTTAPELPFGGVKQSGYGRELSELGLRELVNHKMVVVARDPAVLNPA